MQSNGLRNESNHRIRGERRELGVNSYEYSEMMGRIYNYMKISEMSRYGIRVFKNVMDEYLMCLTEKEFITLAASYWCNAEHFEVRYLENILSILKKQL